MATVAQFIDTRSFAGPERIMLTLCAGLSQRGHRCVVLYFDNDQLASACTAAGIACERLPGHRWYRYGWRGGPFAVRFAMELRRRKVNLLHSHLAGPISVGALGAALAGIPHVGSLHDTYHVEQHPSRVRLLRFAAASGTTLVTVGEAMRAYYARLGPRLDVARIYNGVEVDTFLPVAERPGPFTLVSVGRLIEVKRHDLLIDAIAQVKMPVRLRIIGDGPLQEELKSRSRILGVSDRVEFLGYREDIPALLADAHGFVLSSRSEGLSRSLMEAMAAGLPAVVTAVGGNGELVEQGVTGLMVPPRNACALAAAIDSLAADRALAATMGCAARARAERLFPVGNMVRGYEELYDSLLPVHA